MTNEELNTALYKKVFAEQEKYREWLLSQPPDEILNHCYEYTVREDIVLALEEYDLCGNRDSFVDEHPWCCSLCGNGLCELQRYDRRAICVDLAPQRNAGAQADQIRAGEYLLRGVEGRYQ